METKYRTVKINEVKYEYSVDKMKKAREQFNKLANRKEELKQYLFRMRTLDLLNYGYRCYKQVAWPVYSNLAYFESQKDIQPEKIFVDVMSHK